MPSAQDSLPCPNWVFSNRSTTHIAKDRSWFGNDYEPLDSFVVATTGEKVRVVGRGTVALPVKTSPQSTGQGAHGILLLENVLHCPGTICNIVGQPILRDCGVSFGGSDGTNGSITLQGRPMAYFKPDATLFQVQLSDPPVGPACGPSALHPDRTYMIGAMWPQEESDRF